ncbi:MAG: thioesterase family protein [Caldilineales bacterium]|nr:thioesterase family protein [Caldilineales bacterium]
MSSLQPGLHGVAEAVVSEATTAQAMGSGLVPVFATPAVVALVERAAVAAVGPALAPGQTTVGVHVDLRHLAATPVGMAVRGEATLTAVEGRRLTFAVAAYDEVEKIAEGTHQRVLVDEARFMAGVAKKSSPES